MRSLLVSAMLMIGIHANANLIDTPIFSYGQLQHALMSDAEPMGLPWKTGERASYNIDMGFIKGTAVMTVREETTVGFWLDQDMDLGFMGKQKVEIHIDKQTGKILELRVNGKKQQPPEPGQTEVEETRQDRVTVPAGTFDCIYARIKDISKNETSEAWINPSIVPIMGLIKQVAPGAMGEVTLELTSFDKK